MATVTVDAGICGFYTKIKALSPDRQKVHIAYQTACPHAAKASAELTQVDAFQELFRKPHETTVYAALSKHLPHVTCPLYSAFLKAIELAAGLALPKDVAVRIER
jgi:hypothetical protein